jgi:ubiquinone/menaquinone biosynthesis C-methylase UbiE
MPELVADLMKKYMQANRTEAAPTFLDTSAGDGLSVVAKKEGFSTIHGDDLSEEMLKIAATRNCYIQLKEVNLMKVPLPYDDNKFNAVTCVGALTCVDCEAGTLDEFVRICKRGGTYAAQIEVISWTVGSNTKIVSSATENGSA